MEQTSLIRTEKLVKSYRGKKVVNEVNVHVNAGEIVGLLGPNGAGKTTTFYMVTGLIHPTGGEVFFKDRNVSKVPMYQRARMGMGYLSQEPSIFRKLTVQENVMAILETLPVSRRERRTRLEFLLEELTTLIVTRGTGLLELTTQTVSLEDVFKVLTKTDKSGD